MAFAGGHVLGMKGRIHSPGPRSKLGVRLWRTAGAVVISGVGAGPCAGAGAGAGDPVLLASIDQSLKVGSTETAPGAIFGLSIQPGGGPPMPPFVRWYAPQLFEDGQTGEFDFVPLLDLAMHLGNCENEQLYVEVRVGSTGNDAARYEGPLGPGGALGWGIGVPDLRAARLEFVRLRIVSLAVSIEGSAAEFEWEFWGDPCRANWNGDCELNSQDFFDFIGAFFAGGPAADFNEDGATNSQDFFDFIGAFFAGC